MAKIMEQLVRNINHYREMDTKGMPVDPGFVISLLAITAVYITIGYRLSKKRKRLPEDLREHR